MKNNGLNKLLKMRWMIPAFLLVLPLFSYPLLWKKLFSAQVPLWGEVQAVTLGVIGLCAAGAVPQPHGRIFPAPRRLLPRPFV